MYIIILADRKKLPRINFGLEAARVIHNELDIYEVDTFYLFNDWILSSQNYDYSISTQNLYCVYRRMFYYNLMLQYILKNIIKTSTIQYFISLLLMFYLFSIYTVHVTRTVVVNFNWFFYIKYMSSSHARSPWNLNLNNIVFKAGNTQVTYAE